MTKKAEKRVIRKWTREELEYVLDSRKHGLRPIQIAWLLGRAEASVYHKMYQLERFNWDLDALEASRQKKKRTLVSRRKLKKAGMEYDEAMKLTKEQRAEKCLKCELEECINCFNGFDY